MDLIVSLFNRCTSVSSGKAKVVADEDASEIQLNAFEFRNYKTVLESRQQKVVERIVNQWCAMLVKGKMMKINHFEEPITLDKDMLRLNYGGEILPLKALRKMTFFKDSDDMVVNTPCGLTLLFEGPVGSQKLVFHFPHSRQRLNFALSLRILRTRDPTLEPTQTAEVCFEALDEDDEPLTFAKIISTEHYNVEDGFPIVFSVSDLKLYEKVQSTSRHVYLEFFVRYPSQDKFVYAKSPGTHIPPQSLVNEDTAMRKRNENRDDDDEEQKKEEAKKILGQDMPDAAMRFELKNVKLKLPKVPHTIFGRIMARDDYFPTAVATFEFVFQRSYMQDRRNIDPAEKRREKNGKDDGSRKDPEVVSVPVFGVTRVGAAGQKAPSTNNSGSQEIPNQTKLGLLTLRCLGYVTGDRRRRSKPRSESSEDASQSQIEVSEAEDGDINMEEGEEEEILDDEGEDLGDLDEEVSDLLDENSEED
eukprot:TRINITY_DN67094_c0_g1_i1.p1 TRINITY_DN67094_c0_g1~~TRINITY_DN67094_c0_g1_i1.p1  ORF type:complete len:475 (-),score=103.26 TRINITY_DN67094_c0_g1_i1:115-1539(-)